MKFLDALLGRTRPVPADLDRLFALPSAAVDLQADLGLGFARQAAVCVKPTGDQHFDQTLDEALRLTTLDHLHADLADDRYGYRWALLSGGQLEGLVTAVHGVNTIVAEGGYANQLLCSAFAFTSPQRHRPVLLVYLYKRGSFYPFAAAGGSRRDTELELSIRAVVAGLLPIEADLERWFPLWDSPLG